jgi:hypothetical protein
VLFVLFFYNFFTLRSLITCHRPLHILVVIVLVVLETHIRELALPWLIGRLWLGFGLLFLELAVRRSSLIIQLEV